MPINMKPSNNANKQFYPIKLPNFEAIKNGIKTEQERMKSSKVASFSHNIIKSVAGLAYDFTEDYAPDMLGTFKTMKEVVLESKKEVTAFKDQLKTQFSSRTSKSLNADQITDYIADQTAEIAKRLKKGELYKTRDQRMEEAIRKEFPDLAELENELGDFDDIPGADSYETISDDDVLSPEPFGGVKKGKTRKVNVSAKQRSQRAKSPTKRATKKTGSSNAVVSQLLTASTVPSDTGLSGQIASTATTSVGKALLNQNETVSAKAGALSEFHFNKLYTYQNGILRGINSIVEFNNNVTSKQIASQLEFQGKNLALMQDTFNSIKELKDAIITFNGYDDTIKKDDKLSIQTASSGEIISNKKVFGDDGKLNVKNYVRNLKQNISNEIGRSSLGSILLQTSTADKLLGDDNIAKESMSAMDMISNAMFRSVISRRTTSRLKEISEAYQNFLPMLLGKARATAEYGKTPFRRMLGRILSDNSSVSSIDIFQGLGLGENVNESYRWTRKSDRTLNEVIPTLLSKQLAAITGTDEMYYDYKTGKFLNTKLLESKFKRTLNAKIIGDKNLNISGLMSKNISAIVNNNDTSNMSNNELYVHNTLSNVKTQDIVKYVNTITANITKRGTPFLPEIANADINSGQLSPYGMELTSDIPAGLKIPMLRAFTIQFMQMNRREQGLFNSRAARQALKAQSGINEFTKSIRDNTSGLSTLQESKGIDDIKLKLQELNYNTKYKIDNTHSLNTTSNLRALQARNKTMNDLLEEYGAKIEEYSVDPNNRYSETKFRLIDDDNIFNDNHVIEGKASNVEGNIGGPSFSTEGNVNNIYKLLVNGIVVYPQNGEIPKNLQDLRKRIWNKSNLVSNLEKYESDRLLRNADYYMLSKQRENIDAEAKNPLSLLGFGKTNDVAKNTNLVNRFLNSVFNGLEGGLSLAGSGTKGGKGLMDGQNVDTEQLAFSSISSQMELADSLKSGAEGIRSAFRHIPVLNALSSIVTSPIMKFADSRREKAKIQAEQARDIVGKDNDEVFAYVKSKYGKYPEKEKRILEKLKKRNLFGKLTDKIKQIIDIEFSESNAFDVTDDEIAKLKKDKKSENVQEDTSSSLAPSTTSPTESSYTVNKEPEVKAVSRANREIKPDFSTSSVGMKSIYDMLVNGIVVYNRKEIPKNLAKLRSNLFKYDDKKIVENENKFIEHTSLTKNQKENASIDVARFNSMDMSRSQLINDYNSLINSAANINKHLNYGNRTKPLSGLNVATLGIYRKAKGYPELRNMMFNMGHVEALKWNKELLFANILGLEEQKLDAIRNTDEFKDLEKQMDKRKRSAIYKVKEFFKDTVSGTNKLGKGFRKAGAGIRMFTKDTMHFKKILKLLYNRQHLIDPNDSFDVYKLTKPELIAYISSLPEDNPDDKAFKDSIMLTKEWKDLLRGYSSFSPKNLLNTLVMKPLKAIKNVWMSKVVNPINMVLRKTLPFRNLLELMKLYMQGKAETDPSSAINPNDVYKWTPYQLYANILAIPDDDFESAKFKKALMVDEVFTKLEKYVNEGGKGIIKATIKTVSKIKKALKFGFNTNPIFGKIRRYKNIIWFLSHQKGYEHTIDITDPGIILALLDSWANDESEINGTKSSRELIYRSLKSTKEYMELEAAAEYASEPKGGRTLNQIRKEKRNLRKTRKKLVSKYKTLTSTLSIQGYDFQDLKDPVTLKNTIDSLEDEKIRNFLQSTGEYKRLSYEVDKANYGGSVNNLNDTLKKMTTNRPAIDSSKIKNAELKYRFENRMKEFEAQGEEAVTKYVKDLVKIKEKYVDEMKKAGLPYSSNDFKNVLTMWFGNGLWGINGKAQQLGDKFYTDIDYVEDENGNVHKTKSKERVDRFNGLDDEIKNDIRKSIRSTVKGRDFVDRFGTGASASIKFEQAVEEEFKRVKSSEYAKRLKTRNLADEHTRSVGADIKPKVNPEYETRLKPSEDSSNAAKDAKAVLDKIYDKGKSIQVSIEGAESWLDITLANPINDNTLKEMEDFKDTVKTILGRIDNFTESLDDIANQNKFVKRYNEYKSCIALRKSFNKWKKWVSSGHKKVLENIKRKAIRNGYKAEVERLEKERILKEKTEANLNKKIEKNNARLESIHNFTDNYVNARNQFVNGIKSDVRLAKMNASIGYQMTKDDLIDKYHRFVDNTKIGKAVDNGLRKIKENVKNDVRLAGMNASIGYQMTKDDLIDKYHRFVDNTKIGKAVDSKVLTLKGNVDEFGRIAAGTTLGIGGGIKSIFSNIGRLLKIPKVRRNNSRTSDTNEMNEAYSTALRKSKDPIYAVLSSIATGINRQNDTARNTLNILGGNEKGELDEKNKEAYPSLFYKMIDGIKNMGNGAKKVGMSAAAAVLGALGLGTMGFGAWSLFRNAKNKVKRAKEEGIASALMRSDAEQDYDINGNEKSRTTKAFDRMSDGTVATKTIVNGAHIFKSSLNVAKKAASIPFKLISKIAPNATKNTAKAAKNSIKFNGIGDMVKQVMGKIASIFSKLPGGIGKSIISKMGSVSKTVTDCFTKVLSKMGCKGVSQAAAKGAGKSIPFANIFLAVADLANSLFDGLRNAGKIFMVDESQVTWVMRLVSALVEVIPSIISGLLCMLGSLIPGLGVAAVGIDIIRAFIDRKWLVTTIYKTFCTENALKKLEAKQAEFAEEAEEMGTTAERYAEYQRSHSGLKNKIADLLTSDAKQRARDAKILFGDDPNAMEKLAEFEENQKDRDTNIKNLPYKRGKSLIESIANFAAEVVSESKDWYAIYNQWCVGGKLGKLATKAISNAVKYRLDKAKLDEIYNSASNNAKFKIVAFNTIDVKTFLTSKECANAVADGVCIDTTPAPGAVGKNKPSFFKRLFGKKPTEKEESSYDDTLEISIANKVSKLVEAFLRYFFKVTGLEQIEPLSALGIRQNSFVSDVRIVIHKVMIDAKKQSDQERKFEHQASKNKINNGPNNNATGPMGDNLSDKGFGSSDSSKNNQTGGNGYKGPNNFSYSSNFEKPFENKDDAVKAAAEKEEELNSSPATMEDFKTRYPNISKINDYNDANKVFHDKAHRAEIEREILSLLNSGDNALIAYFANKVGSGWNKGSGKVNDLNSLDPIFKEKVDAMLASKFNTKGQLDEENGKTLAEMGIRIRETIRSPLLQLAYFSKTRAGNGVTDMLMKMAGISEGWNWGKNYNPVTWTLGSNHADGKAIDFDINENNTEQIRMVGSAANSQQLNWGGDWSDRKDYPHVQDNDAPLNNVNLSKYGGISDSQAAAMANYSNNSGIAQQHFAKGGIVIGAPEGDKVPIKANGGEMVLTRPQQTVLFGFLKDVANKYVKGEPVAKLKKNPFTISDERTIEMINEALEIQKKIYEEQVRHDGVTEKLLGAIVTLMQALGGGTPGPTGGGFSRRRIRENVREISSILTDGALANASGL